MKRLLAIGVLAALGACRFEGASLREKTISAESIAEVLVGDETLPGFLAHRTPMLLAGVRLQAPERMAHFDSFSSATTIDSRGYYLTAAHGIDPPPLHLYWPGAHSLVPARVVWSCEDLDLALIHAAGERAAFEWLPDEEVVPGILVASGGHPGGDFQEAAGELLRSSSLRLHCESMDALRIVHSTPLRIGDSGGPLVDHFGRLIGIDTSGERVPLPGFASVAVAVRPDIARIRELIELDQALQP